MDNLLYFCFYDALDILNYSPVWYLLYAFCIGAFPWVILESKFQSSYDHV